MSFDTYKRPYIELKYPIQVKIIPQYKQKQVWLDKFVHHFLFLCIIQWHEDNGDKPALYKHQKDKVLCVHWWQDLPSLQCHLHIVCEEQVYNKSDWKYKSHPRHGRMTLITTRFQSTHWHPTWLITKPWKGREGGPQLAQLKLKIFVQVTCII